jgi:hypothetical protein
MVTIRVIDLVAAALTTNTAFDLVRQIEEDIKPAINTLGRLKTTLISFHRNYFLQEGNDEYTRFLGKQDNAFAPCTMVPRFFFLACLSVLVSFNRTPEVQVRKR